MKNRDIKEVLLYAILIYMMVMSLNLAVVDSTGMEIGLFKLGLYTILIVTAVMAVVYYPLLLTAFVAAGGVICAYAFYKQPDFFMGRYTEASAFIKWTAGYIVGTQAFDPNYSMIFAILYALLVTAAITLLVISDRGSILLILSGTLLLSFFWFIYVEKARNYLAAYLFSACLIFSYKHYKRRMKEWLKKESIVSDNLFFYWMSSACIILSIAVLISFSFRIHLQPLRWPWMNNQIINLFPSITEWRNDALESYDYGYSSRYNMAYAGYKETRLGGPVVPSKETLLTIDTTGHDTLYLRGSIKDIYTGSSWRKSAKVYSIKKSGEALVLPFDDSTAATFSRQLQIVPKRLITSTIFAPNQIYSVNLENHKYYIDEDSEAYFSKVIKKDESYSVESIVPYLNETLLRQVNVRELPDTASNLKLPDTITERTRLLAQRITENYTCDYDKIKAVESYLRADYKYTLNPPKIPNGREFADYFLFEKKEGYCTYFATSMAVLLRAAGIPCRYVEGFMSKYGESGTRTITGSDAHAWVEVNFGTYGWITFEATPAYPIPQIKSAPEIETALKQTDSPAVNDTADLNSTRRTRNIDLEEEDSRDSAGIVKKPNEISRYKIILLGVLLLLILRIAQLRIQYGYKEIYRRKQNGKKYAWLYMKDLSWYFNKMKIPVSQDATMREIFRYADFYLNAQCPIHTEVIDILEQTAYGNYQINSEEKHRLESLHNCIRKQMKHHMGRLSYYFCTYIVGQKISQKLDKTNIF